jgi:hypothetical protein
MSGKAAKVVITEMQMTILKTLLDLVPLLNVSFSGPGSF